jgi:hypothetical protein
MAQAHPGTGKVGKAPTWRAMSEARGDMAVAWFQ